MYDGYYNQSDGAWWGWRESVSLHSTNSKQGANEDLSFIKRKELSVNLKTSLWNRMITADASFFVNSIEGKIVTSTTQYPEYFFTSCTLDESASNNGHYHSDKLEDLEKQMKQEFDADKRSDLAIQMQQTILDDNAYVFCSYLRMSMIMQSNVTGLTAHPCDYYELTADLDIN